MNFGSKEFAIIPDILGEQNRPIYQAWLSGEDATVITVDIACEVIRQVVMQENKTGIHHSEQIFSLALFLRLLEQNEVAFEERSLSSQSTSSDR